MFHVPDSGGKSAMSVAYDPVAGVVNVVVNVPADFGLVLTYAHDGQNPLI